MGSHEGQHIARQGHHGTASLLQRALAGRVLVILQHTIEWLVQRSAHHIHQNLDAKAIKALLHVHTHHILLLATPLVVDHAKALVRVLRTNELHSLHFLHLSLSHGGLQDRKGCLDGAPAFAVCESKERPLHGTHIGDGTHSAKCPLIHVQFRDKPQVGNSYIASPLRLTLFSFPHITAHLPEELRVPPVFHLTVNDGCKHGLAVEQRRVVGEGGVGDVEVNGQKRDLLTRPVKCIR